MAEVTNFSSTLLNLIPSVNQSTDGYINYINDHKNNIISNSFIYNIDADTLAKYIYRPQIFITEKLGLDANKITWIFLLINNFASNLDFNNFITSVYVPDMDYLNELEQIYKAILVTAEG